MKIAQIFPNKIRSTHEFVCCFGDQASRQTVVLSEQQASYFYRGQNIELEMNQLDNQGSNINDGEVLLFFRQSVIGLGQNKKGKIKNGLPRELVKDNYSIELNLG